MKNKGIFKKKVWKRCIRFHTFFFYFLCVNDTVGLTEKQDDLKMIINKEVVILKKFIELLCMKFMWKQEDKSSMEYYIYHGMMITPGAYCGLAVSKGILKEKTGT